MSLVEQTDSCWLWNGARRNGYGNWYCGGRQWYAHRWSYTHHRGEIPPRQVVMHKCDTPQCVRPDHLALGSQADNLADMRAKGRGKPPPVHWREANNKWIDGRRAK